MDGIYKFFVWTTLLGLAFAAGIDQDTDLRFTLDALNYLLSGQTEPIAKSGDIFNYGFGQSFVDPYGSAQTYGPPSQSYAPQYQPPSYTSQYQPQPYAAQPQSYAPQPQSYAPAPQPQSYEPQYAPQSYAPPPQHTGYAQSQSYEPTYQPSYTQSQPLSYGYGPTYQPSYPRKEVIHKPVYIKEKVYVPIRLRRRKKKMKIISIQKGFYIPGGTQLFGKYKDLKSCEKACSATPNCFAGDYNPWLKKCYIHSNFTACAVQKSHKKLVHFKKVPCDFLEAPRGRVMLGVQLFKGIEQKGIKSLSDCLKKCAGAGNGIPAAVANINQQICFGIDYDFGSHKCYFHVDNDNPANHLCPADGLPPPVPRDAVPNPSVISIILCPGP